MKWHTFVAVNQKALPVIRKWCERIGCSSTECDSDCMHVSCAYAAAFNTQISFRSLTQWIQWICAHLLRGLRPFATSIQLFSHSCVSKLVALHCKTNYAVHALRRIQIYVRLGEFAVQNTCSRHFLHFNELILSIALCKLRDRYLNRM